MEMTPTQVWFNLLELRRDLLRLELDVLEPPQRSAVEHARYLQKLRTELAQLNSTLVDIARTMQHPSD